MNYEITGKLIVKNDLQKISEKFQKREFVIEVENEKNPQWNDVIKFQLVQDRCDLIENIQIDELIKVYFNIRGTKWDKDGRTLYFTNLECWRLEKVQGSNEIPPISNFVEEDIPPVDDEDSLPF